MNPLENEILEKAIFYAQELLQVADENEPKITAILAEIASTVFAERVGLENKFKTEESLIRKLLDESAKSAKSLRGFGYSMDEALKKSLKRQSQRNNDALRYTFLFSFENYVFGFKQSLQKLKQNDFEIPENKIWNAWKNIGTTFDKGYRGINITIISSRNQKIELQFHTRESYELKTETHYLYEESRQSQTQLARKIEIAEMIISLAQKISTPKGVMKL